MSMHDEKRRQATQSEDDDMELIPRPQPPQRSQQRLNSSSVNSRTSSTEETEPDSRYECAICMNWLNEPVLTKCGHLFCKSCLNSWLRNKSQWCPMDNKKITENDIFPDNFTKREIEQIQLKCPNTKLGCDYIASPLEMERHKHNCPYRSDEEPTEEKCPFASIKCEFVGRPETNALEMHLKEDMPHHLQLMLRSLQNTAISTWNPQKPQKSAAQTNGHSGLPPPPQYANGAEEQLIQAMYQRIVVLEQRACEQDVKIENLTKQISSLRTQVDPRYSCGTILWEIQNFHKLVEHLRSNTSNLVYSRECYTSPYGYKFCARLNIQPKNLQMLSLHVHLMQSENDGHLEWPFIGRIKLCMVHRDMKLSQHDTIMTKPEILAFHQPRERISTRGFGFVEYANIADIIKRGYCENDRLVIKIQINMV
ncbi:TNF receptor-associated factor 6 [Stomoxys calcitrans]|uniref:TNF receptor-associated factor 6 n=1 Tax=Stomoxys calcitrans TaxID=35570 RepID=A0A1I8P8I3_STOCA|nr:TNF receptor-associated factor 6 [Stomoxys calcitrans]